MYIYALHSAFPSPVQRYDLDGVRLVDRLVRDLEDHSKPSLAQSLLELKVAAPVVIYNVYVI